MLPIYKLIKNGQIQHSLASDYIVNKTKLYLMYCSHLSFYFALKSQRQAVDNHPIVKNILQFRNVFRINFLTKIKKKFYLIFIIFFFKCKKVMQTNYTNRR